MLIIMKCFQAAFWLDTAPGVVDNCMQEVDREDLRELLASQSCCQDQSASTGIKMLQKENTEAKVLKHFTSKFSNHLFFVLQWTKIQKVFSSQPGPTHF